MIQSIPAFCSLLHLWLYRLISSNETISRWSQQLFLQARPSLPQCPLLCCHGDAVSTRCNLLQTFTCPCSPSLSLSVCLSHMPCLCLCQIFILCSCTLSLLATTYSDLSPSSFSLPLKARWCFLVDTQKMHCTDQAYLMFIYRRQIPKNLPALSVLLLLACPWNSHRSTKTHPGPVVHISDNPMDEGKVTDSWPLHSLWIKDKFLRIFLHKCG